MANDPDPGGSARWVILNAPGRCLAAPLAAAGEHPTRWARAQPTAVLAAAFQSSPPVARQTIKAA
ncbi:hypothetical protein [Streptomonospora litoralis]|uniref:hypothetical protein n=1 Tax=Streptomonospora litoralis TaxID=2498135 RepID=UPI001035EA72|nr:hypothetical protein [Streptomonospora litoralis]